MRSLSQNVAAFAVFAALHRHQRSIACELSGGVGVTVPCDGGRQFSRPAIHTSLALADDAMGDRRSLMKRLRYNHAGSR